MRLVLILAWLLIVIGIAYLWMRRALPRAQPPALRYDELVKDPVCHTYVSRSRAVSRNDATGRHYFCSAECARRYASLG
jgi:YHS domain-containing protein